MIGEHRCTRPRSGSAKQRIVRRERVDGGLWYHLECECGDTWTVTIGVDDVIADRLAAR